MENFSGIASPVGDTKASMVPAMIRMGIDPSSSFTASLPARASDSRRGNNSGEEKTLRDPQSGSRRQ